ncbi:hypothetical protein, partial [Microbacterium sp. S16(2024)]|uniref:hypothetical protein n=1 Tax=Microbacterium sp. S16(2024) TaxID=3368601 RepID=UPI00373EAAB5
PAAKAYTLGTLPAGTTMLNAYWALSPTGNLYYVYASSIKLIDTNVSSATAWIDQNNYNAVNYLIGTTAYNSAAPNGSTATPAAKAYTLGTLPAGTTMLNAYWALSPTGNLYYVYGSSTKLVDTNVSSATAWVDQNNYNAVNYLLQSSC